MKSKIFYSAVVITLVLGVASARTNARDDFNPPENAAKRNLGPNPVSTTAPPSAVFHDGNLGPTTENPTPEVAVAMWETTPINVAEQPTPQGGDVPIGLFPIVRRDLPAVARFDPGQLPVREPEPKPNYEGDKTQNVNGPNRNNSNGANPNMLPATVKFETDPSGGQPENGTVSLHPQPNSFEPTGGRPTTTDKGRLIEARRGATDPNVSWANTGVPEDLPTGVSPLLEAQ